MKSLLTSSGRFIGSVRFSIVILLALAAILAVATFYEAYEGTGAAQMNIYRSGWFTALLLALVVNLIGGTIKRFRYRWAQTGFLTVHLGVFLILLAAFITRTVGIEGQMSIVEGDTKDYFIGGDDQLSVSVEGKDPLRLSAPIPSDRGKKVRHFTLDLQLPRDGDDVWVTADRYFPHLDFDTELVPGGSAPNPAVGISISAMGQIVKHWLVARDPSRYRLPLGPMTVALREGTPPPPRAEADTDEDGKAPRSVLLLTDTEGRELARLAPEVDKAVTFEVDGRKYTVTIRQVFRNFVLDGGDYHDHPGPAQNPAVIYDIESDDLHKHDVVFANYPDFSSSHGREALPFKGRYLFHEEGLRGTRSGLTLWVAGDGSLTWVFQRSSGEDERGPAALGEEIQVGSMGLAFTIETFYPRARQVRTAVNRSNELSNPSIHVKVYRGREAKGLWLPWGTPRNVTVGGVPLTLLYQGARYRLPFSLKLLDFNEDKYPGTTMSATFQSDVFLEDPSTGEARKIRIEMNEPLRYRGYTFFQSSYIPGEKYTSVFSVSKDPGKWPTYIGYIVLVLGMILMFYFKPYLARFDRTSTPTPTPASRDEAGTDGSNGPTPAPGGAPS